MDIKKILRIPGLKYILVLVIFAVYILFIDDYSIVSTSRLKREVRALHVEEQELRNSIAEDSIRAAEIHNDMNAVEHYGRENYYMKRDNEDVFVVSEK